MFEFKKLTYVIPLLVIFSNTNTFNFFNHNNAGRRHSVTVNTFGQVGSNAITSDFMYSFLNGSYLDNSIKDPVRDKLGSYNRMGMDWMTEISYMNLNDSVLGNNWGYYLGIKNRAYADARFTSDLFNVTFYGNSSYAGQTARFSDSYGDFVMYQQFQVGFIKQVLEEKHAHAFGFGVSFLNGNMRNTAGISTGTLYTDVNGEYLDVTASLAVQRTSASNSYFMANNGSGLSLDLFYEYRLGTSGVFSMSVNDFGFINWDRPGGRLWIDSTINFDGVEIGNILETDGSEFAGFGDSLRQYVNEDEQRYGLMMLPINVNMSYAYMFKGERVMLQGGVQFRSMNSFVPLIYARGIFYPHRHIMIGTMIGYGGFSVLNVGLDLGFDFGKGYIMQLSTRNLEGVVPNTFGTALSAGFKFSKLF